MLVAVAQSKMTAVEAWEICVLKSDLEGGAHVLI